MLVPFELKAEALDRMLNFEIADHAVYSGLEIQGFDDDEHGNGMVVFLNRRENDLTDVYYESSLSLNPNLYGIGGGLGLWKECQFDVANLSLDDRDGIAANIKFNDHEGRLIEVQIGDPTPLSQREFSEFLAPVGCAIVHPKSLLLVWMSQFDLLYRRGKAPLIRIDNQPVKIGQLPMEWLLRRRLVKVASDLFIVMVNPVPVVDEEDKPQPLTKVDPSNATITSEGLESATVVRGKHVGKLDFVPAFPDLEPMKGATAISGRWSVTLDGTSVTEGSWSVVRESKERKATVTLEIEQGWKPRRLPFLMRFVTWAAAKVFRQWPTTYKYSSIISWDGNNQNAPTMEAHWERVGSDQRGEAYRTMTGTKE